MFGFLSVAWWAAKLSRVRAMLSPWVVIPVAILALFVTVKVTVDRAFERGESAGYARKTQEVADETAATNRRLAHAAAETARINATAFAERARLVAQVQLMARTEQAVRAELETVRASKTKIVERPVVKIRRVTKVIEQCGVGDTMAATLNAIR